MLNLASMQKVDRKPAIYVEETTLGRRSQPPGHELVLPPDTHHIELRFDAIELSSPEKIRLQYRLDSVDPEWLDASPANNAIYTNIPPGEHLFHLRACNRDGIWDRVGIVYGIRQQPHVYETNFFRLGTLALLVAIGIGAYRLRVRQIATALQAGFDERLDERTRLARDLHDTLLQTIQGGKLVVDEALDHQSDPIRMRKALERLSVWLGEAIQEARSAVNSLRISTIDKNDLANALRRAGEECQCHRAIQFSVVAEGEDRSIHPILHDEIYRIGYEAIRNACVPSQAAEVAVELTYTDGLTLRVRDNGKGIDPEVAAKGRGGHFGLLGMYERASRIRGKLTISSSPGTGTLVELIVPRSVVFPTVPRANVAPRRRTNWFRRRS
jgi:signal transduction histidine kinase